MGAAEEGAALKVDVTDVDVAVRLLAAVGLGGAIGLERELSDQPAGLRTHITVALGAALFGVLSVHGFDAYVQVRADSNYQIDVTRVASQVVVGVGFLGAGAILKEGLSIRGLTTAASLWATAAIGLAVGLGSLLAGSVTTALLLLSFVGLRAPRRWVRERLRRDRELLVVHLPAGADPSPVIAALVSIDGLEVRSLSTRRSDDAVVVQADVVAARGRDLADLLRAIAERDDVAGLDIG